MALDSRLSSLKDAIKEDWVALEVEENEEGLIVKLKESAKYFASGATEKAKGKQERLEALPAA